MCRSIKTLRQSDVPATDDEYAAIATFLRDAGLPVQE